MIKNIVLNILNLQEFIYKVKENESIEELSKAFNIPVSILKGVNKIEEVSAYERIIIPKVEGVRYIVKPFESIEDIANRFNTSVENIKNKNYIDKIYAMQEIII